MIEVYNAFTLLVICITCIACISDLYRSSGELKAWAYILTAGGSFWLLCIKVYWSMMYSPDVAIDELSFAFLVDSAYPLAIMNTGIIMLCLNAVVPEKIRTFAFVKSCSVVAGQKAK